MLRRDADPSATRDRIQVRRALAHQVGQPEQALRSHRRFCGLAKERVVIARRGELVAKPLQAEARALCDAHDVPLTRHGVTEGVHASQRIVGDLLHVREDHTGRAQRARDVAQLDDPVAHRARCLIAAATDDRSAGGKARQSGNG